LTHERFKGLLMLRLFNQNLADLIEFVRDAKPAGKK
jgi:hypothetical protein